MDFYLSSVFVFPDFVFGDVPCSAHAKRPEGTICLDVRTQMLILFTKTGRCGFLFGLMIKSAYRFLFCISKASQG